MKHNYKVLHACFSVACCPFQQDYVMQTGKMLSVMLHFEISVFDFNYIGQRFLKWQVKRHDLQSACRRKLVLIAPVKKRL